MTNEKILAQLDRAEKSADRHVARDLALCIENDGDIYCQNITYVIENLRRKHKKGAFDKIQAIQAFYNVVNNALAMPRFYRDYSYNKAVVDVPTRYAAAAELAAFFMDEIEYTEN